MKTSTLVALGTGLLLAFASAALADGTEKIFRLKNGRKMQGEIIEETTTSYVIRTSGGKTTLPKDLVASVENPPPPPKPFLEPENHPAASPDEPSATAPMTPSGDDKTPAPPPTAVSESPLASETEIADAKKQLADVPASASTEDEKATREKALKSVREAVSLTRLVAVCAELPAPTETKTPPERLVAMELVAAAPASDVRPLLAQGLLAADFSKGIPTDLISLIARVGPDDAGVLDNAVLAKVAALVASGSAVDSLEPAMRKVGTGRDLRALYSWLLAHETKATCVPGLGRMASDLVNAADDLEAALRPLVPLLEGKTLPDYAKLTAVFGLLKDSRGDMGPTAISLVNALERQTVPAGSETAWRDTLSRGYRALASMGSIDARQTLLQNLRAARAEDRRVMLLEAIARLTHQGDDLVVSGYLDSLVEFMSEGDRSEAELTAAGRALGALTQKSLGSDPSAWRDYLKSLRH